MRLSVLLGLILLFASVLFLWGLAHMPPQTSFYIVDTSIPFPEVSASAWGVFDTENNTEIISNNAKEKKEIASLTKLMTASIAFRTLQSEATTTLSYDAIITEGRAGRLEVGETLSVRELLFPLLLESSNDAAEALAQYSDRNLFISRMNDRAVLLGMADTVYVDPSGLSSGNVSTVKDIALLTSYIYSKERHLLDISHLQQYVSNTHTWVNVNPVSQNEDFYAGKHGYTDTAKRTLVAIFNETFQDTKRPIIYILFGSDDLENDVTVLRSYIKNICSMSNDISGIMPNTI